ncbi:hypothetical protein L5515_013141 [Caenorhabditis briggsae]|uniref:Uncharacterized protein n=1 Tax=Caenorhabditis briggsae TaxID=6238 RepID=A0AAE9J5V7_CAEBR|nr:hypothetical protein L5515_013141 [Caenorhabditis briggsae]
MYFNSNPNRARQPRRAPEPAPDEDTRTRAAIQFVANRDHEAERRKRAEFEEASVYMQAGYGDSDSSDDQGCLKVPLPKDQQHHEQDVFMLPEHRNQSEARSRKNPFSTFPTTSSRPPADPNALGTSSVMSSDSRKRQYLSRSPRDGSRDSRRRGKKSNKRRRRHSSSSSTSSASSRESRRRHRDRKKKSKKRRRRSSSGSSGTSSGDSRRNVIVHRKKPEEAYGLLKSSDDLSQLYTKFFVINRTFDPMMFTTGNEKKHVAKMHLTNHFILGLEHKPEYFKLFYEHELKEQVKRNKEKKKKEEPRAKCFYKELEDVARTIPGETYFRKNKNHPIDGYWKVLQKRDILNEQINSEVTDAEFQHNEMREEIGNLRKRVTENKMDVESLINLIRKENELAVLEASHSIPNFQDLAERQLTYVEKMRKFNARSSILRIIEVELMRKAERPLDEIAKAYRSLLHEFPHDPMVWWSQLDYLQYDSNVYSFERLRDVFYKCLNTIRNLATGGMQSHANRIADMPQFKLFYFIVYLRFLKWIMHCGLTPVALANVQGSMEYRFGFIEPVDKKQNRQHLFNEYWDIKIPRIGDPGGQGMEVFLSQNQTNLDPIQHESSEMERWSFDAYQALEILHKQCQSEEANWVEYERKMQNLDCRVKRNEYQIDDYIDLEPIDMFGNVMAEDLHIFNEIDDYTVMDWTQPMLEMLGVKFLHSSGCFTTTEHVISEWIQRDIFKQSLPNFPETPAYTEPTTVAVGMRILRFLLNRRHQEVLKTSTTTVTRDDSMMKYLLATVEMNAKDIENAPGFEYFKIKQKTVLSLQQLTKADINLYKTGNDYVIQAMSLHATLKMTQWFERAVAEQSELLRLQGLSDEARESFKALLDKYRVEKKDIDGLASCRTFIWKMIDSLVESLNQQDGGGSVSTNIKNPSIPYPVLQLVLFAKILKARQYVFSDAVAAQIRIALGKEILEENDDDTVRMYDKRGILYREMIGSLLDQVQMLTARDEYEETQGIPEFPRVGALCTALHWAVEFIFLKQNKEPRKTLNNVTKSLLEKFDVFDEKQKDWNRGDTEKYRDRVDIQFLLDTLIALFHHKDFRTTHFDNYHKIVLRSSATFNCETKYMLKLAELYSTNRFQWMKIRGVMDERNKEIRRKSAYQFDFLAERRLLMNNLAVMFSTMRICAKIGGESSSRMQFKEWNQRAMTLNDPSVWRMVMHAAKQLDLEASKEFEETFTRAIGQCQWAHNLSIDYVAGRPDKLKAVLLARLDQTVGQPHTHFVENLDTLSSFRDIGAFRENNPAPPAPPPRPLPADELLEVKEEEIPRRN